MYKLKYVTLAAVILSCCGMASCGDNYPEAQDAPYATDLLSIKIVNGGPSQNETFVGKIDEENKMVNFPRMDTTSNFSALKIEAQVSAGATVQKTVYDFSMDPEDTYKTLVLRVSNHTRYKDYFIKVRKLVELYGADFEKVKVSSFTGDTRYQYYNKELVRGADFDGTHVLIVARNETTPHLLKVSDLQAGKQIPIQLDLTGVSGGTFAYNMGALANGHVYLASLSGGKPSPLKIYYWDTPTSKPEVIANINIADIPGAGDRHGDNMSLNIDKDGNGYIFFGDNGSTEILRFTVTGHKTIGNPTILPSNKEMTANMSMYRIEATSEYLLSGLRFPVALTDEMGNVKYQLSKDHIAAESIGARIFTFNKARYLLTCTVGFGSKTKTTPTMNLYDITKGNTVQEALERFTAADTHNPVYSFILGGTFTGAPGVNTNYFIERDADGNDVKLYLFASRVNSGFVICELPAAADED